LLFRNSSFVLLDKYKQIGVIWITRSESKCESCGDSENDKCEGTQWSYVLNPSYIVI
jgi:hypothetical protein